MAKNANTRLYQLAPTGRYMMGFVIITKEDNAIVIDGGRTNDAQMLKSYIGNRHISAWILTHPHDDHIGALVGDLLDNGGRDLDIEAVYYNFPSYEEWSKKTAADVPDIKYFTEELNEILPDFNRTLPILADRAKVVRQGDVITVDECRIDFLYTFHDGLYSNPMNDASTVFKITTPEKAVLFLGDLGAEGGDILFEESRDKLKADIVQMAHHGHMNVGFEVYAEIAPEVCLWCTPDWVYDEPVIPSYLADRERMKRMKRTRLYGAALTRKWMKILGVKEHYVTKDGTHELII